MFKQIISSLRYLVYALSLVTLYTPGVLAECGATLDEGTVQSLSFGTRYDSLQFQPGQTVQLHLYKLLGGVDFVPVDACVAWSLNRKSFVVLDSLSGLLKIDAATPHGTSFVVTANVENGRRVIAIAAYIYRPEENPLIGVWQETQRFRCDSGKPISVIDPIRELVFRADGKMHIRRFLFENLSDFQASYLFDLQSGDFAFVIDQVNLVRPVDVDGFGRFRLKDDLSLMLHKLSFGKFAPDEKQACKYQFVKVSVGTPR